MASGDPRELGGCAVAPSQRQVAEVGDGRPVVADGLIRLVHPPANLLRDASRIRALDAATGEERRQRRLPDGSAAAAAVADGRVYVQGARAQSTAFDAVSGEELWHQGSTASQLSCCTPSVAHGMVCAGTGAGQLHGHTRAMERVATALVDGTPVAVPPPGATPARGSGTSRRAGSAASRCTVTAAGSRTWPSPRSTAGPSPSPAATTPPCAPGTRTPKPGFAAPCASPYRVHSVTPVDGGALLVGFADEPALLPRAALSDAPC
ncbi:PQQ-binding-like beta-propeller repeat protein [Streptomyces sp. NBC_01618]|uniref:outer membrane protein assembly factor BamB family protein n=1 Tax=Streptomyces sp. NBC_01618 TaxID=2975900 RepID=UPI00386BDC93|nr:PQQ-binding-like beta-propeller repeat protein [Streptomyces sp. NBC_01618]